MQKPWEIAALALLVAAAGVGIVGLVTSTHGADGEPVSGNQGKLGSRDDGPVDNDAHLDLPLPDPTPPFRSFDEPPAAELASDSPQEEEAADRSGRTRDEKIELLLRAHERLISTREADKEAASPKAEIGFAVRAVSTILGEQGRADYGDPAQLERDGGFKLGNSNPDEIVFAADGAKFTVFPGEFPAFDLAYSRAERMIKGENVEPLSETDLHAYEGLFGQSLRSMGIEPQNQVHKR